MSTVTQVPQAADTTPQPTSEELEKAIRAELRNEAEQLLLIWKKDELASLETRLNDQVKTLFDQYWEQWKKDQAPPTPEQIQKLLSQEYATFTVSLTVRGADGVRANRDFVIQELPQSIERKFYRQFKTRLAELAPKMQGFVQANVGKDMMQLLQAFLETFDSGFDIMSDTVAIVLDPFGEDEAINGKWVQDNIGSQRQMNIIKAQAEVNRLRDFFSQLFQAGQQVGTITNPLSFQQLLEQSRS